MEDYDLRLEKTSDGEWVELYIRGALADKGHSLRLASVLEAICKEFSLSFQEITYDMCSVCERKFPEDTLVDTVYFGDPACPECKAKYNKEKGK